MKVGSLFSGYGGLDLAVGGELAWYSEIEPAACKVMEAHYPGVPNLGDITQVDWAEVEPVDVITGGYPCQPFSSAGMRKGKHDERHLWPHVRDAISAIRPRRAVLENVRGHLTLGFDIVLTDLAALGLSARWGVVRAADAGAPHNRARLFIVTDADGQGLQRPDPAAEVVGAKGLRERAADSDSPSLDADAEVITRWSRGNHDQTQWQQGVGELRGSGGNVANTTSAERRATQPDDLQAPGAAESGERASAAADTNQQRLQHASVGMVAGSGATATSRHSGATANPNGAPRKHSISSVGVPNIAGCNWGDYAPAIDRWQHVIGRPAPSPTIQRAGRDRLNPVFVEWMMGLPEGWVTGHGLSASQELKMLGNGVVPQQAALALQLLGGVA